MDYTFIYLITVVLMILGILGTFIPVLPGLLLSLCGLLIYKFGTDAPLSMVYVWIFVAVTAISVVLNYVIPARTNRKYGGTRWGSVGSVIGTFAGMFFIPVPFGFLIGMFLGVLMGNLFHKPNAKKNPWNSLKALLFVFFLELGFSWWILLRSFLLVLFI